MLQVQFTKLGAGMTKTFLSFCAAVWPALSYAANFEEACRQNPSNTFEVPKPDIGVQVCVLKGASYQLLIDDLYRLKSACDDDHEGNYLRFRGEASPNLSPAVITASCWEVLRRR